MCTEQHRAQRNRRRRRREMRKKNKIFPLVSRSAHCKLNSLAGIISQKYDCWIRSKAELLCNEGVVYQHRPDDEIIKTWRAQNIISYTLIGSSNVDVFTHTDHSRKIVQECFNLDGCWNVLRRRWWWERRRREKTKSIDFIILSLGSKLLRLSISHRNMLYPSPGQKRMLTLCVGCLKIGSRAKKKKKIVADQTN